MTTTPPRLPRADRAALVRQLLLRRSTVEPADAVALLAFHSPGAAHDIRREV